MNHPNKLRFYLKALFSVAVLLTVTLLIAVGAVGAQDLDPEVVVTPQALESISWGAVLAGVAVAMVIQLGFNLLGISVGASSINPEYGHDSASAKAVSTRTVVFAVIGALLALFIGGWIAARFAGAAVALDGILHGIVVWAVVMLLTIFLLSTAVGRILSGVSSLLNHSLSLAGSAARGAGNVAGSVARGAGNVAGSAARGASHVAADAVSNTAQTVRHQGGNAVDSIQNAVNNSPEVQDALHREDLSFEVIREQVMEILRDSGQDPQRMQQQADLATEDVKAAAQAVARHPEKADKIIELALRRVFRRGQAAVNDVDRDSLVNILAERSDMSKDEIRSRLDNWEQGYTQARQDTERTVEQARTRYMETRHDLERRFNEMRSDVEHRVEEVRDEVEHRARDAAQSVTNTIAAVAGAAFAAIVIGAVAAGIGGLLGMRTTVPAVEVEEATGLGETTGYVIPGDALADAGLNDAGLTLD